MANDILSNPDSPTKSPRIMLMDDEELNILLIQSYLQGVGYSDFIVETEPRRAMAVINSDKPDIVISDICMPGMSGLELLAAVRKSERHQHLPVLLLTASTEASLKLEALRLGASDFLAKPIDASELALRVQNVLSAKTLRDESQQYSERLERQVLRKISEVESTEREVVAVLAQAAEYRDDDTGRHIIRVGRYAGIVGRALGLPPERIAMLEQAAQLHDVGKIGIPDSLLLKPGKFTPEEFQQMKHHAEIGRRILSPEFTLDDSPGHQYPLAARSPILQLAALIAGSHHEKWDGSGYPNGLAGAAIPLEGRITAIADVFDALSSSRPYKQAFEIPKCFQILRESSGSHFDPAVVEAFFASESEILDVYARWGCETQATSPQLAGVS